LSIFRIAEVYPTTHRTPSPGKRVDFFIDNQQNSKQSASPGSFIDDIIESPEQEKVIILSLYSSSYILFS
jgi:hypothetical protein